ncbi:hypothetical protein [Sulfitobacter sp. MF3-043]|uniref:hypothetical protein n=1 Tax=Sulfitobacter sediminivivens TaxID=3252902 RepID=UPI0036DA2353
MNLKANNIPRDWSTINSVRASFVSQALAAASLSIVILPKTGFVEWVFGADWRYYVTLVGAFLFLLGYLFPILVATPEYRQPRSRTEHLEYWKSVSSWGFFSDRRDQFKNILDRFEENQPPDLPNGTKLNATTNLTDAKKLCECKDWKSFQGAMYDADLQMRAYDQHGLRCATAVLLFSGICTIVSPNVITFLCYFLKFCGE